MAAAERQQLHEEAIVGLLGLTVLDAAFFTQIRGFGTAAGSLGGVGVVRHPVSIAFGKRAGP